jgi:hypothetical protein
VEVIAATTIMAVLTTSSFAIVRTAHSVWTSHRADAEQRRAAIATLQHIVRTLRQATEVTAITSSSLTALMSDSSVAAWGHNSATEQARFGSGVPTDLLANGITQLSFVGLTANGVGTTTDPTLVHAVRCTAEYRLTRPSGVTTERVTCVAWLRSW